MSNKTKTLEQTIPAYLKHLEENGKSKSTIYTYSRDGKLIIDFFGEGKQLNALRATDIGRFLKSDQLLKKDGEVNRANATIQKTIRFFRMMLEWAHEEGFTKEFQFPKSAMPKTFLKEKEAANANTESD